MVTEPTSCYDSRMGIGLARSIKAASSSGDLKFCLENPPDVHLDKLKVFHSTFLKSCQRTVLRLSSLFASGLKPGVCDRRIKIGPLLLHSDDGIVVKKARKKDGGMVGSKEDTAVKAVKGL